MKIKLAENIKAFRKERKMTQEQLAEALGVTVGAVHKWEKDLSTPDISLILSMADLFDTSTDVLLGYEWRNGNAGEAIKRIQALLQEKKYGEAVAEAEKSMKKFPNNFEVVYQGAMAYLEWSHTFDMNSGIKDWQKKAHTRGEEVFQHALELLPQNTDPSISQVSLCRKLAEFHEFCMYIYQAIDVLKKSNACGINDARIGNLYVTYVHDPAKAEEYLSKAYTSLLNDMDSVILGFADICGRREDQDNAIACIEWLRCVHRGIQPDGELTEFDRYDAWLLRTKALYACQKGDYADAKKDLKEALEKAVRYDHAAPGEIKEMKINRLMHIETQPRHTSYMEGKTAVERLELLKYFSDEFVPQLKTIWEEVKKEVLA